jgi:hypothetical protein
MDASMAKGGLRLIDVVYADTATGAPFKRFRSQQSSVNTAGAFSRHTRL